MATLIKRGKLGNYYLYYYENKKLKGIPLHTNDYQSARKLKLQKEQEILALKLKNPIDNISLDAFVSKYLNYAEANKKPTTVQRDKKSINQLLRTFNIIHLNDIDVHLLETYKNKRIRVGIKPSSVNRELTTFKGMLNKAVEWGFLQESPGRKVKYLKVTTSKVRYLDNKEIRLLLDNVSGVWKTLAMVGLYTGFRISEILSLTWDDCKDSQISVTEKPDFSPKDYDTRTIPLHPKLSSYLATLKRTSDYVVAYEKGERPRMETVSSYFGKIFNRLKMKGVSFHSLRHTFASHLSISGVDLYAISKLLGHVSIETTQIYAHLCPSYLEKTISKIDF